jgi:hypothetical protein
LRAERLLLGASQLGEVADRGGHPVPVSDSSG